MYGRYVVAMTKKHAETTKIYIENQLLITLFIHEISKILLDQFNIFSQICQIFGISTAPRERLTRNINYLLMSSIITLPSSMIIMVFLLVASDFANWIFSFQYEIGSNINLVIIHLHIFKIAFKIAEDFIPYIQLV